MFFFLGGGRVRGEMQKNLEVELARLGSLFWGAKIGYSKIHLQFDPGVGNDGVRKICLYRSSEFLTGTTSFMFIV